jgi:hypothetical protein
MPMNILITGGTGFIGGALSRELKGQGHSVVITTRRKNDSPEKITWKPPALIPSEVISRFDAVINLAGESIAAGRWTAERKQRIRSSRIDTTHSLVESMKNAGKKPRILISASAVGYYGPCGDETITEGHPPGSDFLSEVTKSWEKEALMAAELGIRVVIVRFGTVLEADGGALPQMVMPFRFFIGGPIGSGKQWFSWVHRDDLIGIIIHCLEHDSIKGPVNVVSPQPVTNREFSSALGRALRRPSWLPVPAFVLRLAMGELGSIVLTGQMVVPEKILKAGYQFKYPDIDRALKAIFSKR